MACPICVHRQAAMGNITKLPSGSFRVRIRRTGAPLIARTFASQREAEKWMREQEGALASDAALPLSVREYKQAQQLTLRDLAERYLQSFSFRKKTQKTQRGERIKLPHLLKHLGGYSVVKITPALIAAYRDARLNSPTDKGTYPAPDQVRLEMALLCIILELAATEWCIIPANPCKGVKKPSGTYRDRRLSEEEEVRLRVALMARKDQKKLLRFVLLAFYTGMRAGEVAELKKNYIDLEKKQIKLPHTVTKNKAPKLIPLSDEVLNVIKNALAVAPQESSYLFSTRCKNGGAYRPYDYGCAWQRTLDAAQIADLRFHDLRHEFVSRLFEKTNLSDGQIAALSGHTDPRSLWRYKHLRTELLRPAIEEHNLALMEREVMANVEQQILASMMDAIQSDAPDWKRLQRILEPEMIKLLRKAIDDKNGVPIKNKDDSTFWSFGEP